jgi:hypothetical protein
MWYEKTGNITGNLGIDRIVEKWDDGVGRKRTFPVGRFLNQSGGGCSPKTVYGGKAGEADAREATGGPDLSSERTGITHLGTGCNGAMGGRTQYSSIIIVIRHGRSENEPVGLSERVAS